MKMLRTFLILAATLGSSVWALFDHHHDGLSVNKRLDCYREAECKQHQDYQCKSGYTYMGWSKDDCDGDTHGHPICCNDKTVKKFGSKKCMWRGEGPNCNGAGAEGEVVLFKSENGGGPTDHGPIDSSQCHTGHKYFTCPLPEWEGLTSRCRWTDCKGSCDADETEIAFSNDMYGRCPHQVLARGVRYCCRNANRPLTNCHWVGQNHCDDNTCNPDEVTAARNQAGDSFACIYGREKSLCCTPGPSWYWYGW